ncbi:hypothetical protein D9M71_204820 [compost metagenome]
MQRAGDGLQVVPGVLAAEQLAAVGIEVQVDLAAGMHADELRAAVGSAGRQVLADFQLRIGRAQALHLLVGTEGRGTGRHPQQVVVHQLVELRLEQVDDPGQRQQDHERCDEQPGVEMPAPGQVVEIERFLVHLSYLHSRPLTGPRPGTGIDRKSQSSPLHRSSTFRAWRGPCARQRRQALSASRMARNWGTGFPTVGGNTTAGGYRHSTAGKCWT